MIVLLHGDRNQEIGANIASNLRDAFKGNVEISLASASSPSPWPTAPNWDDFLIVVFDETPFPDAGNAYISNYLNERKSSALILPIALNPRHKHPPKAASAFKAFAPDPSLPIDAPKLAHRIGAMLGLNVQGRDNRIFISYRECDGTETAQQLETHLKSLGYPVWRDEAIELDGETAILPGSKIQLQIDQALKGANIVLLLDTPEAPNSVWIKHEVDTANGLLLPILPLCFRIANDRKKGPRFRSLLELQRWVDLPFAAPPLAPKLTDESLRRIVDEMEAFLCEMFQRKCRIPFVVENAFISRDFSWQPLDARLQMYQSIKEHSPWLTTKVLSHCSIFDQVHGPAIQKLSSFLKTTGRPNHSLYIYDGELIPEPQMRDIGGAALKEEDVVILHHQELAVLLDSNFTKLR